MERTRELQNQVKNYIKQAAAALIASMLVLALMAPTANAYYQGSSESGNSDWSSHHSQQPVNEFLSKIRDRLNGAVDKFYERAPFGVTNPDNFSPFVYDSDVPLEPAADPGWTEAQTKFEMKKLVIKRSWKVGWRDGREARQLYNELSETMDPRLAAGAAHLVGRVPGSVLDFLHSNVASIEFAPASALTPGAVGESFVLPDGSLDIRINEDSKHEDPALLGVIIYHEMFHQDAGEFGRQEETAIRQIQNLLLQDLISDYPDIADEPTELLRGQMTQLLALNYNSNTALEGRGDNILPGGNVTVSDFYTQGPVSAIAEQETAGNQLFIDVLNSYGVDLDGATDINGDGIADFTTDLLARMDIDDMIQGSRELNVFDLIKVARTVGIDLNN